MLEKMKKTLVNIFLSLDALLPMLYVFLIKENTDLIFKSPFKECLLNILNENLLKKIIPYKPYVLAGIYLVILVVFSKILLIILKKISTTDKIQEGSVEELEIAIDSFLPSYLGYFFVALSIPDFKTFWILFILIYLFVYKSKLSHFNPILLILGYKYYYFTSKGIKSLIITKRKFRNPKEIEIEKLIRINDYTFIDIAKGGK